MLMEGQGRSGEEPQGQLARDQLGSASSAPARAPTRASGLWAGVVAGLVLLLVLIIFLLENGQGAKISFFGAHGQLPQGVALALAVVIGGLLVALAGALRILELRHRARKEAVAPVGDASSAREANLDDRSQSKRRHRSRFGAGSGLQTGAGPG